MNLVMKNGEKFKTNIKNDKTKIFIFSKNFNTKIIGNIIFILKYINYQ